MGKIDIVSGISESGEPIVVMTISEGDSQGHVVTMKADGAIKLAVDVMRAAHKAQIAVNLYNKLQSQGIMVSEQIDKLMEGLGD